MKILIVDDNPIDIALLTDKLETNDSQVNRIDSTASAQEALTKTLEIDYDVILLDFNMPAVTGLEMVLELRARDNLGNVAVIIVSASQDMELALKCIEAGAQDFLPKADITQMKLFQAIIHAKKRFEFEKKMMGNYLAAKSLAERDPLTGLYNRYFFDEHLRALSAAVKRTNKKVAVLTLDLDNFKHINDSMGHAAGDELLKGLVSRVTENLRESDCFARLGGDEFAIVLSDVENVNQVSTMANRVLSSFSLPFLLDLKRINATVSIGAALMPEDTTEPAQLLKYADIAMYRAKQKGKNTFCFYKAQYQSDFNRHYAIQHEMTELISNDGFLLVYQGIYDKANGPPIGAEALLRWPEQTFCCTPDEFIPVAEDTRQIHKLGEWVINTSIKQLAQWQTSFDAFSLSINVSAKQLENDSVVTFLVNACQRENVSPHTVILEITETALLLQKKEIKSCLAQLNACGFRIALDDFGMGYSSISHLTNFPIDMVKLEKSMQCDGENSLKKQKVLEAVVSMLNMLDLTIVAEGIETSQQLKHCQGLAISRFQGFLLAKPCLPENIYPSITIE